jgi:hypothetical protein
MDGTPQTPTTAEKMKTVKAAWDAAPESPRKDAALRHYRAAQLARSAGRDGECNRRLDSAAHALS